MKNLFIFTFLAFFFLLLVSAKSDIIKDSCKNISNDDPVINLNYCIASLRGNPKSKTANTLRSLVSVALDTAITNLTVITDKVFRLLNNESFGEYARMCLADCAELYTIADSDLQSVLAAFESNDFGTAKTNLNSIVDAPSTCEDEFGEEERVISPLKKENNDFFQLALIPLAFMNRL